MAKTLGATAKAILKPALPYAGLPAIEAAMLFSLAGRADAFILLLSGLAIAFGYAAAAVDAKSRKIPNGLVLAMFAAWVLAMAPKLLLDIEAAVALLGDAALGSAVGGGLFLLVYLISRKGLGGGDVKFMAAAGLYLGFAGALSAMLLGTALAALAGLALLLLRRIKLKDSMPLVPFIYIGMLITVFFGR